MHTPGPWKYCTGSHGDSCICGLVSGCDRTIAMVTVDRCPVVEHEHCEGPPSDEMKSNARLIAAAPELLAACKELLTYLKDQLSNGMKCKAGSVDECSTCIMRREAVSAVAKAEGK